MTISSPWPGSRSTRSWGWHRWRGGPGPSRSWPRSPTRSGSCTAICSRWWRSRSWRCAASPRRRRGCLTRTRRRWTGATGTIWSTRPGTGTRSRRRPSAGSGRPAQRSTGCRPAIARSAGAGWRALSPGPAASTRRSGCSARSTTRQWLTTRCSTSSTRPWPGPCPRSAGGSRPSRKPVASPSPRTSCRLRLAIRARAGGSRGATTTHWRCASGSASPASTGSVARRHRRWRRCGHWYRSPNDSWDRSGGPRTRSTPRRGSPARRPRWPRCWCGPGSRCPRGSWG